MGHHWAWPSLREDTAIHNNDLVAQAEGEYLTKISGMARERADEAKRKHQEGMSVGASGVTQIAKRICGAIEDLIATGTFFIQRSFESAVWELKDRDGGKYHISEETMMRRLKGKGTFMQKPQVDGGQEYIIFEKGLRPLSSG